MKRSAAIVSFCFLTTLVAAVGTAQSGDVRGSKDHPLVSRYPGLVIRDYVVAEFDQFDLPLGRLKSDSTAEKSQRLEGKITRIAYDAPSGRSILEIYRNYEDALKKAGFEILFACVNNQGCGSGAPTLFAAKGRDDWGWGSGQRYLSAKLSRPEGDAYVSLHLGQWSDQSRGSAILLYVVEVKPMESGRVTVDAGALASDIARTGHSAVYGIYFDTGKTEVKPQSDAALKEIAKLLQQDAQLKLLVVGHTDSVGTLASNMDLSKRRADAVVQALTTRYGVAPACLLAQGAGPLAPVASNRTEEGRARNRRVELVEQ
jgi:OmpA-OmpF porin, OOP family